MDQLLDTHLLLWSALEPDRLPRRAEAIIRDPANQLFFSLASIWETGIKFSRGRKDFTTHPLTLKRGLIDAGFRELPLSSEHVAATVALPHLHRDPFDRILIAQAIVEGMQLVTADLVVSQYSGPILKV